MNFTTTELTINLEFENKKYVSSHSMAVDVINVTIYGFHLFADTSGNFMRAPTFLLPKILPQMISESDLN